MPGLTWNGFSETAASRDCPNAFDERSLGIESAEAVTGDLTDPLEAQFAPLVRAIEAEIIPRLMLAHGAEHAALEPRHNKREQPSSAEVLALSRLVLERDAWQALTFVESVHARGVTYEALYLELLAPAARYLGELWEADLSDFVEVTVALGRLHQVLRRLSPMFRQREDNGAGDRKILLAVVPGEQHSFGLSMVEEFFRRAGWDVCGGASTTNQNLSSIVRSEWFDVAGFSVGSECKLDVLTTCICSVRAASLNRKIGILVGGPLFVGHPELVSLVGADATTEDARQAVYEAENLVASLR